MDVPTNQFRRHLKARLIEDVLKKEMIKNIAKVCFWISLGMGALGQLISFYPGAELNWFSLAAAFSVLGLLIPKWSFRLTALAMLITWSVMAFSGYTRGKEYQAWLKQQPTKEERIQKAQKVLNALESEQKEKSKDSEPEN